MIIDMHTHRWETPDQLGAAAAQRLRGMGQGPWDRLNASTHAHLKATEATQYAIVHGFISQHLGARIDSEQVAEFVAARPDRLLGFAGIDPMADDYMAEFDKAVELGLVGVTISPAAQAFHPAHTRAMRLYERCEQLGMPVFVHPDTHLGPMTQLEFAQPYLFDEVARTFPDLPLIFAQVGHPWVDQALTLIGKHPNVYADLSDLTRRPWQLYNVLLLAYQQQVHGHLLFGSDFPFSTPEEAIVTIYSVNTLTHGINLPTVPREALRSIVERDALTCLGLTAPTADAPAKSRRNPFQQEQVVVTTPARQAEEHSSDAPGTHAAPSSDSQMAADPAVRPQQPLDAQASIESEDDDSSSENAKDAADTAEESTPVTDDMPSNEAAPPPSLSDPRDEQDQSEDDAASDRSRDN